MSRILLFSLFVFSCLEATAQVTTSSIVGVVTDGASALPGATVLAVHQPSGTQYGTSTNGDGRFTLPGLRTGGPYTIEVSFVGYQSTKIEEVYLKLGQPYVYEVKLTQSTAELTEVVVTAEGSLSTERTGASTNLNSRALSALPTISRSITDFTRLTPQANGNNFAGRDGRYNNIQVDGANLNNNFGLSSDPLPGGGNSPISLDSYDEISVNIAPYDVRQSGFTGAGINAVTKSGTNDFKGTAYMFWRNQNYLGSKVGDNDISPSIVDSKNNILGFSLGGPIIKNKLFFFVNGEQEKGSRPGVTWSPTGGSGNGNTSSTPIDSLKKLSDFLKNNYGYETGAYDNFPNFENENTKMLLKLDYNINKSHRLTFKYSYFKSTNDQQLNNTSVPNGGGFSVTGRSGTQSRLPFSRFSNTSMSYANSNYQFEDKVTTGTLELNSRFGENMSNQLLLTLTNISTNRNYNGPVFPSVDIFDGSGNNYISFGMDPYTNNNKVVNDVYTITDNFTYFKGEHTITAGVSYEFQKVGNMFMPASNSYYVYDSLDAFLTNKAPSYFAYTYSLVPGKPAVYSAELKVGQLGIYAQDEINLGKLKLTAGLRLDKAIYGDNPLENPAATALDFYDEDGNITHYNTGKWPSAPILFSPRVGFRYDVKDNQQIILRGGTGIFTGRIPFVFLTNMPTNSGMYQFGARLRNSNAGEAATLSTITFDKNPDAYANLFPTTAGTSVPGNIVFINNDFKFPQVWRTNFAVDKALPWGLTATVEALFTKDINAVKMRNANFKPETTGVVTEGGKDRPRYLTSTDRNLNSNITTAIVLENTNKGYSTALTFQLSKAYDKGFFGSVAYTYTAAEEVTANPGNQASSVWNTNPNVGTSNAIEMANSQYVIPHRVIVNVSYKKEYLGHMASTLSLFYEGMSQGNYSFVINGDINNDGNSSADLMYIPRDVSEMNFEAYSQTINGTPYNFSVEDQEKAFEEFISNSSYLKDNRGSFAERNSAYRPWLGKLDLRFLQEFYIKTGNDRKHTLQFSIDIFNFGNMLNSDWGVQQITVTNNPLSFRSINNTTENKPLYRLQNINGELVTKPFQDVLSTSSTWSMQMGLRYTF